MFKINRKIIIVLWLSVWLIQPIGSAKADESQASSNVFLTVEEESTPPPITPPGTILPPIFDEIRLFGPYVRATTDEAVISWSANKPVHCQMKWGLDQDMGEGVIEQVGNNRDQRAHLTGLSPDTEYYFQIHCADNWGHQADTLINSFRTEELADTKAPANVTEFTAEAKDGKIELNWINPEDKDLRAIKITRSEDFYPMGFNEGTTVYNDKGNSTIDSDVRPGKRYYYTAFSYDNNGNYSSGAIASARVPKKAAPGKPGQPEEEDEEGVQPGEIIPLPPAPPAPPEQLFTISPSDFSFFIANQTIALEKNEPIVLLPGTLLTVKTDADKYPKVLKSIILTLIPKPEARATSTGADLKTRKKEAKSYLLRVDSDNKYYTSNFAVPVKIRDYEMHVYFLNYANSKLAAAEDRIGVEQFGRISSITPEGKNISLARAEENGGNGNGAASPVYTAEISLYQYENGEFKKWKGESFSQFNPLYSNQLGQYGFLVPDGTYLIKAKKDNYFSFTSLPFEVKNNLVNQNIELIYYPKSNAQKYFLTLLLILLLFLAYERTRKKNKKIPPRLIFPPREI